MRVTLFPAAAARIADSRPVNRPKLDGGVPAPAGTSVAACSDPWLGVTFSDASAANIAPVELDFLLMMSRSKSFR